MKYLRQFVASIARVLNNALMSMHRHHFSRLAGELSYSFFTSVIGAEGCNEDKVSSIPKMLKTLNKRSKLALAGLDSSRA